jgi:hypothetical protein
MAGYLRHCVCNPGAVPVSKSEVSSATGWHRIEYSEIIRNRMKIEAAVRNARAFLKIQEEFGSFDSYCCRFVDGQPKLNPLQEMTFCGLDCGLENWHREIDLSRDQGIGSGASCQTSSVGR